MATRYKLYPKDENSRDRKAIQRTLDDGNLYVELNDYPFIADPSFTRIYKEGVTQ